MFIISFNLTLEPYVPIMPKNFVKENWKYFAVNRVSYIKQAALIHPNRMGWLNESTVTCSKLHVLYPFSLNFHHNSRENASYVLRISLIECLLEVLTMLFFIPSCTSCLQVSVFSGLLGVYATFQHLKLIDQSLIVELILVCSLYILSILKAIRYSISIHNK